MSNKSRLQTNNTNLQALIDKANSLPDAGSGLETVTITLECNAPVAEDVYVYYVDGSSTAQSTLFPAALADGKQITVQKNSLLVAESMVNIMSCGSVVANLSGRRVCFINNNGTLILGM